jgi:hypothetical protein
VLDLADVGLCDPEERRDLFGASLCLLVCEVERAVVRGEGPGVEVHGAL